MAFVKIVSASQKSSNSGASVVTTGVDTTGANLIVVNVSDFSGGVGALTDSNSNTWTGLTAQLVASNVQNRLYYNLAPTVGSGHTFTYTSTSGTTYPSVHMIAFSGTATFDQQSGFSASASTIRPGSLTPPGNNALFVTGWGFAQSMGGSESIDSGFTKEQFTEFTAAQAEGGAIAYLIQTTAAALNPLWGGSPICAMATTMATFNLAAAGAAPVGKIISVQQAVKRASFY